MRATSTRRRRFGARARRTTRTGRASTASPSGCARCSAPTSASIYVVRDPIDRMLSHYLHNVGGGYEDRSLADALSDPESSYVARSRYFFQLEPYLEAFGRRAHRDRRPRGAEADRPGTMRRAFEFLGVDPSFTSEQFEREWETGVAKTGSRFRLMDRAVRLPGLRAIDRNFDRLPESLRWVVERFVHDPAAGEAPKPEAPRLPARAPGRSCSATTSRGSRGSPGEASAGWPSGSSHEPPATYLSCRPCESLWQPTSGSGSPRRWSRSSASAVTSRSRTGR